MIFLQSCQQDLLFVNLKRSQEKDERRVDQGVFECIHRRIEEQMKGRRQQRDESCSQTEEIKHKLICWTQSNQSINLPDNCQRLFGEHESQLDQNVRRTPNVGHLVLKQNTFMGQTFTIEKF